jgi:Spy/CpxP family protein refolding chaperone
MKISKNTLIIGLILLNIGVLTFFFLNKPPHPPIDPKQHIISELNLNEDQVVKFEKLIEAHQKKMHLIHDDIRKAKKEVYQNILNDGNHQDSLLDILGEKHVSLEELHIQHLNDIKEILTENQIPDFKELLKHIDRAFGPRPPKPLKH